MDEYSWEPMPSSSSVRPPTMPRSYSQKSSQHSSKIPLPRSSSLRTAPTSSSYYDNNATTSYSNSHDHNFNPSSFTRSSSVKHHSSSSKSSSSLQRSGSHKGSGSGSNGTRNKYSSLAKEQKARFYIMRRCIAMLVCWHKHDS